MAQADDHRDRTIKGCNIESDYSLTTYREAFVFTRDDAKAPKRMSLGGGKLYVDGREAELNAADQARVAQFESELRQLLPEVQQVTIEAIDIAWPSPQISHNPPTSASGTLSRMIAASLKRRNTR